MTCADERVYRTLFTSNVTRHNVRILWEPSVLPLPAILFREVLAYWDALPKENIFNGKVARLDDWRLSADSKTLDLHLRPSDYRTLMYSNANTEKICQTWGSQHLARVLGISAVLLSAEKDIILMKRSQNVGEFPGCFDVFGGHIDVPVQQTPCVFEAMQQELEEEVGILPFEYDLRLIGLIESAPNKKPELVFQADCQLTTLDIYQRTNHARDQMEYSDLLTLANKHQLLDFLAVQKQQSSPSAYGSLCLFAQKK